MIELNDATRLLEWFYDEITECAILRCLPCLELHLAARPTLRPLTPFRAQQLLNPTGNGTLSSGIFVNKETSRLFITGHNQVTALIIFVSLDVDQQNTQKQWRNMERGRSTYTENLQYAKTSFEPQLLMLSLGQLEDTLKLLFLS
jgi:hypothetical protein